MPLLKGEPVIIVEYDSTWPVVFDELSQVLHKHLKEVALSIEHVGSTSVHGLAAKPIIDLVVVIESADLLPEVSSILSKLGYSHKGNGGIEGRESFDRSNAHVPFDGASCEWLDHHLYVCAKDNAELRRQITFRDFLRNHPGAAQEYGTLKQSLAAQFRHQRSAYTDAKTDFVHRILQYAHEESACFD